MRPLVSKLRRPANRTPSIGEMADSYIELRVALISDETQYAVECMTCGARTFTSVSMTPRWCGNCGAGTKSLAVYDRQTGEFVG